METDRGFAEGMIMDESIPAKAKMMLVTAKKPSRKFVFTMASTWPLPGFWMPMPIMVTRTAAKMDIQLPIARNSLSLESVAMCQE